MPEPIESWWARRQWSRQQDVPYPVGTYREAWSSFPVLVRQYHAEFNRGVLLSQIPPTAEVYLCWQCDAGHLFVATPAEQRSRPGRERRRSSWCPDCSALARPRPAVATPKSTPLDGARPRAARRSRRLCTVTPELPTGEPFASTCAPKPASAVEGRLRHDLAERLEFTPGNNAIRVSQPFFDHFEIWPDVVLPELRVAIEYDSTGRHGLEHVGKREVADRRKDRAARSAGWEVVRIRTGRLPALGPYDLEVTGLSKATMAALFDRLREIRGALIVDAYLKATRT